jgi:hypothetical protein
MLGSARKSLSVSLSKKPRPGTVMAEPKWTASVAVYDTALPLPSIVTRWVVPLACAASKPAAESQSEPWSDDALAAVGLLEQPAAPKLVGSAETVRVVRVRSAASTFRR